jgi:hypothetical protein
VRAVLCGSQLCTTQVAEAGPAPAHHELAASGPLSHVFAARTLLPAGRFCHYSQHRILRIIAFELSVLFTSHLESAHLERRKKNVLCHENLKRTVGITVP